LKELAFHYHLKLNMSAPVSGHHFTLRCTPADDGRQSILQLERYVYPADFLAESRDGWGNALLYGSCREAHSSFEANLCGRARTGLRDCVPGEKPGEAYVFRMPTALTAADEALKDFAAELRKGTDALEQATAVLEAVHDRLCYTPGATGVQTTAAETFRLGKGVCQDFSQIMLAVLREQGIAARYVTGMLMGEGESHAWVEVLHDGSWYAFDPTNRLLVTDRHIKMAHGRDAADCAMNRGIFRGCAAQRAEVSVIVTELN